MERKRPERFSVVVPFFNEVDNVVPVLEELRRILPEAEIIAVDDGSSDGTWERIQSVPGVRGLVPGPPLGPERRHLSWSAGRHRRSLRNHGWRRPE
jgi:GT2 family glycosyltransferase